jgi:hypothetical protein
MAIRITQSGGSMTGERFVLVPFDPDDLKSYSGVYWSEELETQYTILLRDGRLVSDHAHHGETMLTPAGKDHFRSTAWFMPEVKFIRDSAGSVVAMTLGGNRVTAIRFTRR